MDLRLNCVLRDTLITTALCPVALGRRAATTTTTTTTTTLCIEVSSVTKYTSLALRVRSIRLHTVAFAFPSIVHCRCALRAPLGRQSGLAALD